MLSAWLSLRSGGPLYNCALGYGSREENGSQRGIDLEAVHSSLVVGARGETQDTEGGTRTTYYLFFGWLRCSLDGPVKRKSVLFLSIFVASYPCVWNGFALMVWVNRLHLQMDAVFEKAHQKME